MFFLRAPENRQLVVAPPQEIQKALRGCGRGHRPAVCSGGYARSDYLRANNERIGSRATQKSD